MHRVQVVRADITTLEVDAIVNAANERMLGGGGVDGAIHRAAGPRLRDACAQVPEVRPGVRCPTGEARITPGFDLPAGHVIHTVGPVWHGGNADEERLLGRCYSRSLALAVEYGLRSIAFPAISCGVFGYPPDEAANVAMRAIASFLEPGADLERIVLVAFGERAESTLTQALGAFGD
ncbi:MAG: O-acetyl-ADP-ribose deacetylase [Acidobacteria bacterium]|nr:O-acetyl-ADP-ribose deacetylase [Acidobacteriota bacterium]NIM61537.1 O-acetyl-ADP-ribose deacetylase [Acidobacteriota bacterium]NIO60548.1 O-acetyl-ADP-ribose deacetylase [Acidobacteriota bacterium]NIQ31655.1 O-acetyl-ADP-ribose deacetylase [Acidobacteriota bacterium]NIQ86894.1 O-acetyl-ADP-ribose deacetylase [Acidobacteriota bacterium]